MSEIPPRVAAVLKELNERKEERAKLERAVDLLEAEMRMSKYGTHPFLEAERRLRETHQLIVAGDSIIAGLRTKLMLAWSEVLRPAPCAQRGHEFVLEVEATSKANAERPANTPVLYVEACLRCPARRRSAKQRDGPWLEAKA